MVIFSPLLAGSLTARLVTSLIGHDEDYAIGIVDWCSLSIA